MCFATVSKLADHPWTMTAAGTAMLPATKICPTAGRWKSIHGALPALHRSMSASAQKAVSAASEDACKGLIAAPHIKLAITPNSSA